MDNSNKVQCCFWKKINYFLGHFCLTSIFPIYYGSFCKWVSCVYISPCVMYTSCIFLLCLLCSILSWLVHDSILLVKNLFSLNDLSCSQWGINKLEMCIVPFLLCGCWTPSPLTYLENGLQFPHLQFMGHNCTQSNQQTKYPVEIPPALYFLQVRHVERRKYGVCTYEFL